MFSHNKHANNIPRSEKSTNMNLKYSIDPKSYDSKSNKYKRRDAKISNDMITMLWLFKWK